MSNPSSPAIKTPFGWTFAQHVLRVLLRLLVKLDVQGLEHMPDHGPAIITPNHIGWLDVVLMPAFSKVPPVTFAAEKWGRAPLVNHLFRHFGQAIFVERGAPDKRALKAAMEVLKQGGVLGLAPEGTRSHDGILRKGHDGAAWLASRTDATIIPIAMWGHENVIRGHWLRLRRPEVHFHVGEPYKLPPEARKARSREMKVYTEMIMRRIAAMLPPERRGYYA
ncbi:MAG TPA: 1-acyl-sn-glycerol-3-phosphate acyltransferase [Anaerolineae bacterium]|nr:1-acyl-sn-glycerol-3-phosphate acyltransferase [Anaerolineae bacterium]